jgi:hypothetical protein
MQQLQSQNVRRVKVLNGAQLSSYNQIDIEKLLIDPQQNSIPGDRRCEEQGNLVKS